MTFYYENTLAIEARWLFDNNILTEPNYKWLKREGKINQLQKGGKNHPAIIEYVSIPQRFKKKVVEVAGYDPQKERKYVHLRSYLKPDHDAITFFANYELQDGRLLKTEIAREYSTNAMFLNALHLASNKTTAYRSASGNGKKGIWKGLTESVNGLKDEYKHTLPGNEIRLKDRYKRYMDDGYPSLIHRNFGNGNSRVVNQAVENLILSIACMGNKPYPNMILDMYLQFLAGKADFVDVNTGELFNRFDFYKDNGEPRTISESTVWNILRLPKNDAIIQSRRNDAHSFNGSHRPHMHRHKPEFSLSKISMDDRDLPRKMHGGKRVKAYYAYDVTSTALIGAAYSKNKDTGLFIECVRDMFRFLNKNNFGFPLEVEVEHHLVNQFRDDLMMAGTVFPFVRFCNPGNSQEKHAERMIGAKKYGFEKRYQDGVGRFRLKNEANRPKLKKAWNEEGMQVIEKTYDYDQLVADDQFTINEYNNSLHPNQKKYKGMSRMEVLKMNLNPDAPDFNPVNVARFVGEKTSTSIRRSQYVIVKYGKYALPGVEVLGMLQPNNYKVDAYYLPDGEGVVNEVYLFQNEKFIARCAKLETFNTATAEQTEKDREVYTEQSKYVSKFDKFIKDGRNEKLTKLEIIENTEFETKQPEIHTPAEEVIDWESYLEHDETIVERAINEF